MLLAKNQLVEDFIEEFKKNDKEVLINLFNDRLSYYFVMILYERFNKLGSISYMPKYKHFCYTIFDENYDINGKIIDPDMLSDIVSWNTYKQKDEVDTYNIIKEFITFDVEN